MPYRTDLDALQQRKTILEGELARLREQTSGLDQLRAREGELARELAGVEGRLAAGGATRRPLPMLDQVRVASPCKADWNEMLGDDRVRFCLGCEKNVYNLSSMAKEEAEALLQARLGNDLCIRFYQRADGTILTQDCPVGVKKKQRKKLALAVAGAGVMAAAAATVFMKTTCHHQGAPMLAATAGQIEPLMGEPAIETPPPAPLQEVKGERAWALGAAVVEAPTPVTPAPKPKTPLDRR